MLDLGTVQPGSTIRIPFSTFDKDDGSQITMTNFAVADILIYKDGSTTERASTAGYTATTDFDSKTGKQLAVIDLADNTTAGFFAAGSEYLVAIDQVTVDAVTVGGWVARFRIGYTGATLDTTIATLSSQTSFTLTDGPAEDDALNGMWAVIHDVASAVQKSVVQILDYTGATKTVTLAAGATFTAAATDNISVMGPMPLQPTTTGRPLDVSAGGEAGLDWANVGGQTTAVNLSATTTNLVNTVTTYTGNTPQTGDAFARLGVAGVGLTAITNLLPAIIRENTAQTGTGTSITLDAGASSTNDFYNGMWIVLTGGTGAGQVAQVTNYTGSTKVASVREWTTIPDNTTTFRILGTPELTTWVHDSSKTMIAQEVWTYASGRSLSALDEDVTNIDLDATIRAAVGLASANLDTQIAAIAADNPNRPARGVELANLEFTMVDATDFNSPETGVTVTAEIGKDGGAFAACTNAVSEVSHGFYKITLTATEMTADAIKLKFTGTGCAQRNFAFRTQPT